MKIAEVLAHTVADDKYYGDMLIGMWQRRQSRPGLTDPVTQIGQVQVLGPWPPTLRSIYFFVAGGQPSAPQGVAHGASSMQPIGFVNLHKGGRDGDYQNDPRYGVTMIWIAPEWRRQGLAKAFYDFLQQHFGMIPDTKQSVGGEALWKNRTAASR